MIKIDVNTIKDKSDIKVDGSLRIESVGELLPLEMAVVLHKMYNSNKEAFLEALDISLDWVKGDKGND